MRAIQVSSYVSSPDSLTVTTHPTPSPSPTQYLIRIHAAGTNFFDLLQIRGKYQHQPPLPWISGAEFAGVIIATPTSPPPPPPSLNSSSSPSWKYPPGTRIFGASQGAYATHILASESSLLPIPAGWTFAAAAGLYVTAPTAYAALVTRANVRPGEWVLVHAGAGGVGLCAVQVAKACGAKVIATAGSERKRRVCKEFGADYVLDYREGGWPAKVVEICRGEREGDRNRVLGVDVVFDPVGMIAQSLKCVAWNARLLVIGFAGGEIEKVALNRVLLKNVSVMGLHWGMYADRENATVGRVWEGIFGLIEQGSLRAIEYTDERFVGLESVKIALTKLGGRETWGKVVVSLREDEDQRDGEEEEVMTKERQSKL